MLLLALERHRASNGAYPATIDPLATMFRHDPLVDPVSARPFVYRPLDGLQDFVLYSVGVDQDDNEGRYWRNIDHCAFDAGTGCDFVINRPRPELVD
jgi:hypothetical protein